MFSFVFSADHQKQERRQKIMENRLRRQGLSLTGPPTNAFSSSSRSDSPDAIDPRVGYVTRHYVDGSMMSETETNLPLEHPHHGHYPSPQPTVLHGVKPEPGQELGEVVLGPIHPPSQTIDLESPTESRIPSHSSTTQHRSHSYSKSQISRESSHTMSVDVDLTKLSPSDVRTTPPDDQPWPTDEDNGRAQPHSTSMSESAKDESIDSACYHNPRDGTDTYQGPHSSSGSGDAAHEFSQYPDEPAPLQHDKPAEHSADNKPPESTVYKDYKDIIMNAAFQGVPMAIRAGKAKKFGLEQSKDKPEVTEVIEGETAAKARGLPVKGDISREHVVNPKVERMRSEGSSPSTSQSPPTTTCTHTLSEVLLISFVFSYLSKANSLK